MLTPTQNEPKIKIIVSFKDTFSGATDKKIIEVNKNKYKAIKSCLDNKSIINQTENNISYSWLITNINKI